MMNPFLGPQANRMVAPLNSSQPEGGKMEDSNMEK